MIIIITGASHTGKTLLAQMILERYGFPYLSIDHLKMGLIRSGNTELTPEDDDALTGYLWPIVREIIKTAAENGQDLTVEGCYVPADWRRDFDGRYLPSIRFVCLSMTDGYIDRCFGDIVRHSRDIEDRLDDSWCTPDTLKADNRAYIEEFGKNGGAVVLIDSDYERTIADVVESVGTETEKTGENSMICFLTSRTDIPDTGEMNPANGLINELNRYWPERCRALQICSDPDSWDRTDFYASVLKESFENAGFRFESYRTLDGRNAEQAAELVKDSSLLILSGGHVPTQNGFFQSIGLRGLLKDFSGVVIGISAGSMNSADTVYAQPEEEGEGTDPSYERFLTGLGLTKTMLLPHYQEVKDDILDGLRVFEDITYPDSMGRTFYAIPDGSYLFAGNGREELRGEAYRIKDGTIACIAGDGDTVQL